MSRQPVVDPGPSPESKANTTTASAPRRRFLGRLSAIAAGIATLFRAGAPAASPKPATLHLHDCRIAGSRHYDCRRALRWLVPGDRFNLRREPDNRHDKLAIEVYWLSTKLGYIPRADNPVIAGLLDRGHTIKAELLDLVDDSVEHWEPLHLRLHLELPS